MTDQALIVERGQSVSRVLRERTAEHHTRAERSEFQRRLVSGRLPRPLYVAWLRQLLAVYQTLETLRGSGPLGPILTDSRRRASQLQRDLEDLGATPTTDGLVAATRAFVAQLHRWAKTDPVALIGVLYVLEGSTNGGRYIARALRHAYGLSDGRGLTALDPYGEHQPEAWRGFKADLDASVSPDQLPHLAEAAQQTFDAVTEMGKEIAS